MQTKHLLGNSMLANSSEYCLYFVRAVLADICPELCLAIPGTGLFSLIGLYLLVKAN